MSARLPVFEYEADSEGFPEAASFMSALASAERETVQDILRSLRLHLDSDQRTLHLDLEGVVMISVALIADSGPALEAMTRSLASLPGVDIVRHCHGHARDRRRPHALRSRPVLLDEMRWPRLALQRLDEIREALPHAARGRPRRAARRRLARRRPARRRERRRPCHRRRGDARRGAATRSSPSGVTTTPNRPDWRPDEEMTSIAEHNATVLPFKDALLRAPSDGGRNAEPLRDRTDGPLPDNVIVAGALRPRARAPPGRHWLGGPPEGEAA